MIIVTKNADRFAVRVGVVTILDQVVSHLGARAGKVGKDAYDYLVTVRDTTAPKIAEVIDALDLPSIQNREVSDIVDAGLAVAAAALLDANRGQRRTVTEKVDAALGLLDAKLSAGW